MSLALPESIFRILNDVPENIELVRRYGIYPAPIEALNLSVKGPVDDQRIVQLCAGQAEFLRQSLTQLRRESGDL